jgi:F0F1-type ATP synthase membrane subunit b/b'
VSPTMTTFLFEAANFLVLAGVLAWLFFLPVRESLERRRAAQKQQADDAARKLAAAEQMRSEIEQKFSDLDRELDQRRDEARLAAEQQAAQLLQESRESVRREAEAARRQLTHLGRSQREHLARVIAETAGAAVERLLRQLDQPDLDHALTAAACREISSFDGNSLAPARIESAHPLEEADRDALLAALGAAADTAEFHVVEDLGTGLRVSTNRGLVDVSSAGLCVFAQHQLERQLASNGGTGAEEQSDV